MIHDGTGFAEDSAGLTGLGGVALNQEKAHGGRSQEIDQLFIRC
jgi:hypothetical protein